MARHLPLAASPLWALAVPGHTPARMAYQVGDAVPVGDTPFMPDVGTGALRTFRRQRTCAVPVGAPPLALPGDTRLFMCHDYPSSPGREPGGKLTVQRARATSMCTTE